MILSTGKASITSVAITIPLIFNSWVSPSGLEWLWLVGVGLFTQLGQIWITEGLRLLPAAQASTINYTQVVFSSIWGFIIFSEKTRLNKRKRLGIGLSLENIGFLQVF